MRLHTGAKPFKCPHCDQRFRTSGHRKSHITQHFKPTLTRRRKLMLTNDNEDSPSQSVMVNGNEIQAMLASAESTDIGNQVINIELPGGQSILPVSLSITDGFGNAADSELATQFLQGLEGIQLHLSSGSLGQSLQITGIDSSMLSQAVPIEAMLMQQLQQGNINLTISPNIIDPTTLSQQTLPINHQQAMNDQNVASHQHATICSQESNLRQVDAVSNCDSVSTMGNNHQNVLIQSYASEPGSLPLGNCQILDGDRLQPLVSLNLNSSLLPTIMTMENGDQTIEQFQQQQQQEPRSVPVQLFSNSASQDLLSKHGMLQDAESSDLDDSVNLTQDSMNDDNISGFVDAGFMFMSKSSDQQTTGIGQDCQNNDSRPHVCQVRHFSFSFISLLTFIHSFIPMSLLI